MYPKGMKKEEALEAFAKLRDEAKAHFGDKQRTGAEFDEYIRVHWAKICGAEAPKPKTQTPPREPPPPQLVEASGPSVTMGGTRRASREL